MQGPRSVMGIMPPPPIVWRDSDLVCQSCQFVCTHHNKDDRRDGMLGNIYHPNPDGHSLGNGSNQSKFEYIAHIQTVSSLARHRS